MVSIQFTKYRNYTNLIPALSKTSRKPKQREFLIGWYGIESVYPPEPGKSKSAFKRL
jgi:hypothetical protein